MADIKRWTPETTARWSPNEESTPQEQQQEDIYSEPEQSDQPWYKRILPDVGIGAANLGRSIGNLPYELALRASQPRQISKEEESAGEKQHLLNPKYAEMLRIPEVNKEKFGLKGENNLLDTAIQKGTEYGLPFAGAPRLTYAALRAGGRGLANIMPLTRGIAGRPIARGLADIPAGASTPIASDVINQARQFLTMPQAGPIRATVEPVLARAEAGDPQAIFDLQSSLGTLGHDLTSFPSFGTERAAGRGARDLQSNILNDWYRALRENGHGHQAENIAMGRNRYRNYQQYGKHLRNAGIIYLLKEIGLGGPVTNLVKNID